VSDQYQIEALLYRYAELIDGGRLAELGALFTRGCIAGPDGSECRGQDAVTALYRRTTRIYADTGTPCTRHLTTNLAVSLAADGRQAEAVSSFVVYQALEDFPLQAIISGRYRDSFGKLNGAWHFLRREIRPELLGDLSRHLLIAL
jgi:3-phenylpropionate/cinnamic acid dioxygenase small subunit